MVGHGGSSAGSYLADPTSPSPSHCASIVTTSTVRVKSIESASACSLLSSQDILCDIWVVILLLLCERTIEWTDHCIQGSEGWFPLLVMYKVLIKLPMRCQAGTWGDRKW